MTSLEGENASVLLEGPPATIDGLVNEWQSGQVMKCTEYALSILRSCV